MGKQTEYLDLIGGAEPQRTCVKGLDGLACAVELPFDADGMGGAVELVAREKQLQVQVVRKGIVDRRIPNGRTVKYKIIRD